jgi:hypothetical protein
LSHASKVLSPAVYSSMNFRASEENKLRERDADNDFMINNENVGTGTITKAIN